LRNSLCLWGTFWGFLPSGLFYDKVASFLFKSGLKGREGQRCQSSLVARLRTRRASSRLDGLKTDARTGNFRYFFLQSLLQCSFHNHSSSFDKWHRGRPLQPQGNNSTLRALRSSEITTDSFWVTWPGPTSVGCSQRPQRSSIVGSSDSSNLCNSPHKSPLRTRTQLATITFPCRLAECKLCISCQFSVPQLNSLPLSFRFHPRADFSGVDARVGDLT
jgi:hypothetical protein